MKKKTKASKKVLIEYLIDDDEVIVKSEFKNPERTLKLINLGLEKWIVKYIGLRCPECDEIVEPNWEYCGYCGKQL